MFLSQKLVNLECWKPKSHSFSKLPPTAPACQVLLGPGTPRKQGGGSAASQYWEDMDVARGDLTLGVGVAPSPMRTYVDA